MSNRQIIPAILLPLKSDETNIVTTPAIIKTDIIKLHISILLKFAPCNHTIGFYPEFYGQGSDSLQRYLQLIYWYIIDYILLYVSLIETIYIHIRFR